jgi:hypothetical protein
MNRDDAAVLATMTLWMRITNLLKVRVAMAMASAPSSSQITPGGLKGYISNVDRRARMTTQPRWESLTPVLRWGTG